MIQVLEIADFFLKNKKGFCNEKAPSQEDS